MGEPENPPAFPSIEAHPSYDMPMHHFGMTLRDWFAGQVLAGIAARDSFDPGQASPEQRAKLAYMDADAMLTERLPATPEVAAPVRTQDPPAPDACSFCNSGLPERECSCVPF
jgi:hypothetical protein